MTTGKTVRVGEAVFGGGLIALGALIAVETAMAPTLAARAVVGPALFPYAVAGCLAAVGVALLREARSAAAPHAKGLELDFQALWLVAGGLAVQFLTLEAVGWIPSAAVMFAVTARAFGARRWGVNLALGAALAAVVYVVFTLGLDLNLPLGSLFEMADAN